MRADLLAAAAVVAFTAPTVAQVYIPIPVTGYTQDVIADAGGTASGTTTTTFDAPPPAPIGYVLYEQGFNTSFPTLGVPSNGSIVTSPSRSYQLGPINGNNSLWLENTVPGTILSGTLTLTTPARYSALSLLLADGSGTQPSDGGTQGDLSVSWSNGQTSDYGFVSYDWFLLSGSPAANSGIALGNLDRANRSTGVTGNSAANPVLFYYDFDLSADPNYLAGALIDSVTPYKQPGGWFTSNIMGLSGATSVPEPSTLGLLGAAAGLAFWRRARHIR